MLVPFQTLQSSSQEDTPAMPEDSLDDEATQELEFKVEEKVKQKPRNLDKFFPWMQIVKLVLVWVLEYYDARVKLNFLNSLSILQIKQPLNIQEVHQNVKSVVSLGSFLSGIWLPNLMSKSWYLWHFCYIYIYQTLWLNSWSTAPASWGCYRSKFFFFS